ncbi:hypothetical protein ACET3Z_021239 [Daucus carota]
MKSISFMATPPDLVLHLPATTLKKNKASRQQKREELEIEVSTLHKMLDHEHKVHEILDSSVKLQQNGSVVSVPPFLPPKVKELLTELAMVETEIIRLESQISHLKTDLAQEKKVTRESKSVKWKDAAILNNTHVSSSSSELPPNPKPSVIKGFTENIAFETKALHFISKAIKGDYNLSDFSIHEKLKSSRASFPEQKENHFNHEVGFQERMSKKSGILKPPSPFRDPRHKTPKKERNQDMANELPPKYVSTPIHQTEEENIHKLPPNKLSENIMKCLVNIFVRLIRTSRAMELEKSGPISRSANFSLSFRAETSLNTKASLMLQKDSRQQDPYGIFDMEESIPRDIGPYKHLVRFTSSSLDPKCISNSSSFPLLQKLRELMNGLQKLDMRFMTYQQKLSFWINMYNACIMHGFLQYGVPSSPEKLLTLMNKATLNIGGNTINAQSIEHFILRNQTSSLRKEIYQKDDKEAIARELYGLDSSDPNVTFALCCGTRSSPAVKIYTSDVLAELERTKLEYLQASIVVTSSKRVLIPELLIRNMHELIGQNSKNNMESLVEWVCHQLPASGSLRKSMVDCFRGLSSGKLSRVVDKIPYEFEFQYLLSM